MRSAKNLQLKLYTYYLVNYSNTFHTYTFFLLEELHHTTSPQRLRKSKCSKTATQTTNAAALPEAITE